MESRTSPRDAAQAMSEENVELVQRTTGGYWRRSPTSVEPKPRMVGARSEGVWLPTPFPRLTPGSPKKRLFRANPSRPRVAPPPRKEST